MCRRHADGLRGCRVAGCHAPLPLPTCRRAGPRGARRRPTWRPRGGPRPGSPATSTGGRTGKVSRTDREGEEGRVRRTSATASERTKHASSQQAHLAVVRARGGRGHEALLQPGLAGRGVAQEQVVGAGGPAGRGEALHAAGKRRRKGKGGGRGEEGLAGVHRQPGMCMECMGGHGRA